MLFKSKNSRQERNRNSKKAYWTQRTHFFRADEYICSFCKYSAAKPKKECPRCRAIMKSSKYDPNWVDEIEFFDSEFGD